MPKPFRLIPVIVLLIALSGCSLSAASRTQDSAPVRPDAGIFAEDNTAAATAETTALPTPAPTATPAPTSTPTPTPTPVPTEKNIVISFAGDCTLGQDTGLEGNSNSFAQVVGTDYKYPFKNTLDILGQDDMTLVNFEGTLTDSNSPREKEFTFKGPLDYVNILTEGSVEAVNLANNHSFDYWQTGLTDTENTLDSAGIKWSLDANYAIYETNGVKIGMAGFCFPWELQPIYDAIDYLRSEGCEIVIISVHAGVEKMYEPEAAQVNMAHAILDYGADIYVGHHPHRLQPIEEYNGKYILYSLSNFTFGGQPNLTDKDTAIVQCTFTISLATDQVTGYKLHVIPFSMTTTFPGNDYCPSPYDKDSDGYKSVMEKLNWSDEMEDPAGTADPAATATPAGTATPAATADPAGTVTPSP